MAVYILGISAYYHDSAAALIVDGKIVASAQEERFTRIKGDSSFPHHAINCCLNTGCLHLDEVDYVVFYENSFVKFERLLYTYHLTAPYSIVSYLKAMPKWLSSDLWMENKINNELGTKRKIYFADHHISHAASAFFPSPFQKAAILTIDGVGEWSTTTYGVGDGNSICLQKEMRYPNSFGLLYSAFTYFTGFKINSGEYKLMGLAPYGKPLYTEIIKKHLIHINEDGSIILNQKYFHYSEGLKMVNKEFENLFGGPPRKPESKITQREMDIAASIQEIFNELIIKLANHIKAETQCQYLTLAGGVALNVVSMGKLATEGIFDKLWIQPASGDAGGAIGAALWLWHQILGNPRTVNPQDDMQGAFLGTEIQNNAQCDDELLHKMGAVWELYDEEQLAKRIGEIIAEGKIIGIARGRMEWGPRALGHRSILGDARSKDMQSRMNLKIKYRESFRPFAPMVLYEDAEKYFDLSQESPYMLFVYDVKKERRLEVSYTNTDNLIEIVNIARSDIPAITHVDYSARVQTVDNTRNPFIHRVISEFKKITGYSVIVNTSFNVRGEPIVNTAEDAYRCFMATDMDYVVIGNRLFNKEDQRKKAMSEQERNEWLRRFKLD